MENLLSILKEYEVDIATVNQLDKYESYTYIQKRYRAKAMSYEQWSIVKEWLKDGI